MDEYGKGYDAGHNAGAAQYRAIALRHRDTIKRLKGELEAMRKAHQKELALAATKARARMGVAMALKEHERWRNASIGVADYIEATVSTDGTGHE